MRINIGAGHRTIPGYINADLNPNLPNIDLFCDLNNIPAEPDTYEEVFASHVIEHVSFAKGKDALREWLRVLKPGGVAIIDTPNIQRNIDLFVNDTWMRDFNRLTRAEQEYCSLNGAANKTLWLNFKIFSSDAQYDTHFCNYTPDLLVQFCLDAGFHEANVIQTEPSLIVRAIK